MLIDPGISSLHIAIVSSMRLIVSAMSSLLVLDDVVNALVSIVCVSRLSRFDLVSARGCGSGGGVTYSSGAGLSLSMVAVVKACLSSLSRLDWNVSSSALSL